MGDLCNPGLAFAGNYWGTLPARTQAFPRHPETINNTWELHLPEYFIYCPQAGGVVVGWALRNGGGGVWPSVMKRYEGVGGGQIYGKNALRNTWMAP